MSRGRALSPTLTLRVEGGTGRDPKTLTGSENEKPFRNRLNGVPMAPHSRAIGSGGRAIGSGGRAGYRVGRAGYRVGRAGYRDGRAGYRVGRAGGLSGRAGGLSGGRAIGRAGPQDPVGPPLPRAPGWFGGGRGLVMTVKTFGFRTIWNS